MAGIPDGFVNLALWADELLSKLNLRFSSKKKKQKCLKEFLAFIKSNEYFGAQMLHLSEQKALFISRSDTGRIRPNLELWLRSYNSDSDEKLSLLTERMTTLYPHTGALFTGFAEDSQADSAAAWKLADYLCFALRGEITQLSAEELDNLAADMNRELPLTSARLFRAC